MTTMMMKGTRWYLATNLCFTGLSRRAESFAGPISTGSRLRLHTEHGFRAYRSDDARGRSAARAAGTRTKASERINVNIHPNCQDIRDCQDIRGRGSTGIDDTSQWYFAASHDTGGNTNHIRSMLVVGDGDLSYCAEIAPTLEKMGVSLTASVLERKETHTQGRSTFHVQHGTERVS